MLARLDGDTWLMASFMYGAGMRLMECLRLRAQDLDFAGNEITVRRGKGGRDRITMLPESLKLPLRLQLKRARAVHERDPSGGLGRVQLPEALAQRGINLTRLLTNRFRGVKTWTGTIRL